MSIFNFICCDVIKRKRIADTDENINGYLSVNSEDDAEANTSVVKELLENKT